MLVKLSQVINSKSELRVLAVNGLGMEINQVDPHLENNPKDIQSAVYDVLKEWRVEKYEAAEAYKALFQGLSKCNLGHHIKTVLKPE